MAHETRTARGDSWRRRRWRRSRSTSFRPLLSARFAEAAWNAPVGIQTITGAGEAGAGSGVQTFSFRQSSLPIVVVLPAGLTLDRQGGAAIAFNVAGAQAAAGCGGFQRRSPIGGAANGMPRKAHESRYRALERYHSEW